MKKQRIRRNPIIWWMTVSFLILASILAMMSCSFAYQRKKAELLEDMDNKLEIFAHKYADIKSKNWQVYLPITEVTQDKTIINHYFAGTEELTAQGRNKLKSVLSQMALQDNRIEWIVVYSPEREQNYIYVCKTERIVRLPENFVYLGELRAKKGIRDIYAAKAFEIDGHVFNSITIVGGTSTDNRKGSILIGYDVSELEEIARDNRGFSSLQFCICWKGKVVYNFGYETEIVENDFEPKQSGIYSLNDKKWMVQLEDEYKDGETLFYMVEWWEFFIHANQWSCVILGILLIVVLLAIILYICVLNTITNEVNVILAGLTALGNNQLDYRISEKFYQPEMVAIAAAINRMAETLDDNIHCMLKFEKLQAEAEFAELQSKFNPHFLYNTLEIFRKRCYENGDEETANMIAETAAIFRGFIGAKNFIPIRQELAFCKRYLAIYHARYENTVEILLDVDTEVLQYGIIRNVFQPLIENYFKYGYDSNKMDNYIRIKGRLAAAEDIMFTVEDNGIGMEKDALSRLEQSLNSPIVSEKESYGLRNLNQRLRMFYGEKYGLKLRQEEEKGFAVDVLIKRQNKEN